MKDRVHIQRTFCWKIGAELKLFKHNILQKEKEDIYALAYRIDCVITIYELLMELSESLSTEELLKCIDTPGLLTYLYGKWLKVSDSKCSEMEQSLRHAIRGMKQKAA